MFNRKRGDTLARTIEDTYRINLNARGDMLLSTLLQERGFDSLSQFLEAYRGNLTYHARKRRLFLSFHYEDVAKVRGFRLMALNPKLDIDFHDASLREPVSSERSSYIRQVVKEKISRSAVVVCMIGNGTAWRDWVDWELETGRQMGKGLCGIRLKDCVGRAPDLLRSLGAPVAQWNMDQMVAAIECAAARRS